MAELHTGGIKGFAGGCAQVLRPGNTWQPCRRVNAHGTVCLS
tara:strand:- start:505 stop:630 length:126 start_codon:yes stop_codon:yes gene_type:complete